ncbi:glycosyl hydrolase [Halosolutus gelatinilyticus]|uniref:glycosyl hydrolase n=1 Tax=Halosolutus gelatinilyticus TaxID=2931975 RepID=UPI001FF6752A|nr:glycosyl hydrolase [Halosolutus gelatinilyticus]
MTRDNDTDDDAFGLPRRTYLQGIAAATAIGASVDAASAAVDDSTIVSVGEGSYTTEIPSGYDYAEPMTAADVFTTDAEGPPLPSNDWWSGLHLGYNPYDEYTYSHSNGATVALPYYGFPSDIGLSVQIPDTWKGEYLDQRLETSKLAKMDDDVIPRLFVGHTAVSTYEDVRVDGYGDWNVRARWGDGTATSMDVTMVRGSPFIFVEYEGGGAEIELYEYYQDDGEGGDDADPLEEGRIDVFADRGNVLGVTLYPDEDNDELVDQPKSIQHFGLYAPEGATWDGVGTATVSSQLGGQDYLTVAVLPDDDPATLDEFGDYAYNVVRDTTVDWEYRETDASGEPVSEVETTFAFDIEERPESAASGTLAGLFPHQWKHSDAPLTDIEFWSPKGTMKVFAGDSFRTTLRYPGILPFMPDAGTGDDAQLEQYVENLVNDYDPYEAQGVPNEAYWAGKDLMRNAAAIPIAEQLGRDDATQFFRDAVQKRLECFFDVETNEWEVGGETYATEDGQEVTYYHDDLGIFQTYPGGEFGAVEAINDHHLQFGYFIYVASEIARQNPQWAQEDQYGGIVELMIREYANWERPDKSAPQDPATNPKDAFPFLRTFSPYIGHSYAGGIQGNDWGANQESASEAVASYAAMIRWGEITGNEELRDAGIYLYTHEIHAMWEYWFDEDDDSVPDDLAIDVEPPGWRMALPGGQLDYSPMAWDVGYWRHVYWDIADAIELYGINWIPTGGHSFFLGMNQEYAQTNWDNLVDARAHLADGYDHIDIPDPERDFMDGWQQAAVVYRSMFDPAGAIDLLDSELPMAPEGNSSAFVYQFAHAMNGVGTPDHTVVADAPFYQVFEDGGERTYVAYNASDSPVTVSFSDGASISVPANAMATSDGDGGSGDTTPPTAPSNLTTTGTTETSISIEWNAASDAGGSGLLNYAVYVDGSIEQTTGAGTTSATLTGLDADTEYEIYVTAQDGAGNESAASNAVRPSTDRDDGGSGGDVVTAINCAGDAYATSDGTEFLADQYNSSGGELTVGDEIAGTDDDPIYQSVREGEFEYAIPVEDGSYEVTIHFAELWFSEAGDRLQSVHAEGTERITEYDIVAEAGDGLTAVRETFSVDVTGGELNLFFEAVQDQAHVAAIEVVDPDGSGDDSNDGDGEPELPQSVSSVDYDDAEGDFDTEDNGEGGQSIGWIDAGDWWEYDAPIDTGGSVDLTARVSSPYDGTAFRVEVDGQNVSGTVDVPNTGGWHDWTTVTAATDVTVDAGSTIRVVSESNSWNFDELRLE